MKRVYAPTHSSVKIGVSFLIINLKLNKAADNSINTITTIMKDLKQELEALLTSLNELREAINHSVDLLTNGIEDALKEADAEPEEQKPTVRLVPFDIEKAKQGAKIVTKENENVRIICYDRESEDYPVVALVMDTGDTEADIRTYTKDGKYYNDRDSSDYDLMIEKE